MNRKTKAALKASIKHWEDNVAATHVDGISVDAADCELCRMFWYGATTPARRCRECPIFKNTGYFLCGGTPYGDVQEAIDTEDFAAAHKAAKAELEFLKGLRP